MAALPSHIDPTLDAADRALEAVENTQPSRPYLGMSAIGGPCDRALWYGFRWASALAFTAQTLKRFEDGHRSEALQADRLRLVSGVTLLTVDPETGRQYGFSDHDDHFRGHMDGAILGLLQAPKTWHVWEHKSVAEKKQDALMKAVQERGEKGALAAWDATYYAQACLYMHYAGLDRHYLTCSSPGGRSTVSVRTDADPVEALRLIARARRVIDAVRPPARISEDAGWWQCKWCDHYAVCHGDAFAQTNCRTCLYSTAVPSGWACGRWNRDVSVNEQREGCAAHLFLPELVPGEQTDADEGGNWVLYRLRTGAEWRDGALL